MNSSVLYGATDSTGALADYWAAEQVGKSPFTFDHSPYDGAPEGYPRSTTVTAANAIQPGLIWATKGFLGLVGAWNWFTIAGFVLSAWAMFLLLVHLRFRLPTALLGGYVFGFGPWMFSRAYEGHSGMQHIWVLPLLFFTMLEVHRTRRKQWAAAAGVALAIAFYLHSYIGLMAGVLFVAAYAFDLLVSAGARIRVLALGALSTVVSLVIFAPPLLLFGRDPGSVTSGSQTFGDLMNNGAELLDYVLPSERHPLFGGLRPDRLAGGEHVLFFGYATVALAAIGVFLTIRGRIAGSQRRYAAGLATAVGAVALVTSLKPIVHVGPLTIRTPSDLLVHVMSNWRVYSRVGVVVGLCLIVLASLAFDAVLARRRGGLIGAGIAAFLVFELAVGPPIPTWRTNVVLPHVRWLAAHPGGIVANYPLPIEKAQLALGAREFWYATEHGHPLFALFGGKNGGTREEAIRIVASNVADPLAAQVLAAEHVRYVVVHDDAYREVGVPPPTLDRASYKLVATPGGDTRIFTIKAAPADLDEVLFQQSSRIALARAYPTPDAEYGQGFNAGEKFADGRTGRWMTQNGDVIVHSAVAGRYYLVLDAFSWDTPRELTLVGSGARGARARDGANLPVADHPRSSSSSTRP